MAAPETTSYTWNISLNPNWFEEIYQEEEDHGTIDLMYVELRLPSSGGVQGTASYDNEDSGFGIYNHLEYQYKLQPDEKQQLASGTPVNIEIEARCMIGPSGRPVCGIHSALFDAEPFLFYPNPSAWAAMTIARSQGGGRKSNSKRNKKLKKSKHDIKMVKRTKRTKKRTKQRGGRISSGYYFGSSVNKVNAPGAAEVIGYTNCSEPVIEGMDAAFQAASNLKGGKKHRPRKSRKSRKSRKLRKSRKSRKSRKKTIRRRR
jgi:hypothetical protein